MQVDIKQSGSSLTISLEGDLDFTVRDGFEAELRRVLDQAKEIVLDFGGVRFIDSSGVASILSLSEDAGEAGVEMRIRNVDSGLMEIFELIGVKDVLPFE